MTPEDRRDLGALVQEVRDEVTHLRDELGHRLIDLEHVRVRALEDWRLAQKVLETERGRVAIEAAQAASSLAEQAARDRREDRRVRFSRRDGLLGTALICVVTLLAALIASGHIF